MKKIRLIRTQIIEYIPDAENYPEGFTVEQMAELDANQDDVDLTFMDCTDDSVKFEILE